MRAAACALIAFLVAPSGGCGPKPAASDADLRAMEKPEFNALPVKQPDLSALSLNQLVDQIDRDPETPHGQYTPAVRELTRRGITVIPVVTKLLESPDEAIRIHACVVLWEVTLEQFLRDGKYQSKDEARRAFEDFWSKQVRVEWRSTPEQNAAGGVKLNAWYEQIKSTEK
jgi:hypothetical protein